jgi:hypothetical protein
MKVNGEERGQQETDIEDKVSGEKALPESVELTPPVVAGFNPEPDLSGLTKWSSQQRLIIVVDEKNDDASAASATNITTHVDTSRTVITITTAPMTR